MSNIVIIGAGEFLKGCLETLNEVCPYTRPSEMLMNKATGHAIKVEEIPQHRRDNFIPFLRQIFTWVISKILSDTNVKQVNIYLKLILN